MSGHWGCCYGRRSPWEAPLTLQWQPRRWPWEWPEVWGFPECQGFLTSCTRYPSEGNLTAIAVTCVIGEFLLTISSLQLMLACWMTDPDERPTAEELNLMLADLARGGGKIQKWYPSRKTSTILMIFIQAWNSTFPWVLKTSNTFPIFHSKSLEQCHKCQGAHCSSFYATLKIFTLPTVNIPDYMYVQTQLYAVHHFHIFSVEQHHKTCWK